MRYVFIGNRRFVLEEMLKQALDVHIFVIANTHLHREHLWQSHSHQIIETRQQLLKALASIEYDVLISNGNPYILPIDDMQPARYANIHPSFLPDLKGIDPAHGAVLYQRDGGATCHEMTNQLDSGDIIARIKIPYTPDLDASLYYQLSFIAEKAVFKKALSRDFVPQYPQETDMSVMYYSRQACDKTLTFEEDNARLIAKIKAFNNRSQGVTFQCGAQTLTVYNVDRVHNPYLADYAASFAEKTVILCYERTLIFKKDSELIRFLDIDGVWAECRPHDQLGPVPVNAC